jgi:CHAD domain-containing protein
MYEQVNPKLDLLIYRTGIIESLLRDMAFSISQTLEKPDMANVHDLRRLCLRLRHAVRVFGRLLPPRKARNVQRRLKVLQDLLGEVRTCDVALATIQQPEIASASSKLETKKVAAVLAAERRRGLRPLRARLRKLQHSDAIGRWRARLVAG